MKENITMTSKERVRAAMRFHPPDKVPVQFFYCPVGYYEHGEKLNDLYSTLENDFSPFVRMAIPVIPESDFDKDGNYHAFRRDGFGTLWEYRIFGVAGIPCEFPLADSETVYSYKMPPAPAYPGDINAARKNMLESRNDNYYHLHGVGSLFERMIEMRPETDVLCDLVNNERHIHVLADMITEYDLAAVNSAVANGADGIAFGDDYGTERALIMDPKLFKSFFLPRLKTIFEPAIKANLEIHFHSCGYVWDILPYLAEIGVTSIWPQIPAYDMKKLADRCRELRLSVAIHTDRANAMTFGTPNEVRELVLREYETFKLYDGGGWFYIEADNGFPFANLEALVNTVKELRERQ